MARRILVSAGEASGDLYASELVRVLSRRFPGSEFFGCAGLRMRAAGVEAVVESEQLSVVGLVEVIHHIPRIYKQFRKLAGAARTRRPDLAILTDSPDFHLRLAPRLKRLGVPVVYMIAPQAWAWRKGRVKQLRRDVERLLCIFPFEESFFRAHGVAAHYIGHPLTRLVRPTLSREEFHRKHRLSAGRPTVVLLPGSRHGEAARHLSCLGDAVDRINARRECNFLLALPAGALQRDGNWIFREPFSRSPIQIIEGETWNAIAAADLAMAASGTVTIEAALLGTPMVTFYKVTPLSWHLGRRLVQVPFYTMVNLVAGRRVVPELIQNEMTGEKLALEAERILGDRQASAAMREQLRAVAGVLAAGQDPMERAADLVAELLE